MGVKSRLRQRIKAARKQGARWVPVLEVGRLLASAEGRARVWTRTVHRGEVHQTTPYTVYDRYPELFDFFAQTMPAPRRILSFGCSTGEELVSLRKRFASVEVVGAEINFRSRRIAARRVAGDPLTTVVKPGEIAGRFDMVLALAVLQREPHKIAEMDVQDLTPFYPFARFDAAVGDLAKRVRPGGLLCVANAHYRVEDSRAAGSLHAIAGAPCCFGDLFGPEGLKLDGASAASVFRKSERAGPGGGRGGARLDGLGSAIPARLQREAG